MNENVNYFKLLKEFGSPLYVYDETILRRQCKEIKEFAETLEGSLARRIKVNMHYSTKANSNPYILKIVKEEGICVDCMSPFELSINRNGAGFSREQMLYVCNNISADEMQMVYNAGVLICLDSISQVITWGKKFPGTDIMVRINPGVTGVGHSQKVITAGKETKFGISEQCIPKLLEAAGLYNLNIIGVHQHLGSLFLNDKIGDYVEGVKAGLEIYGKYFKNVRIVDLGGGFGVPYRPDEKPLDLDMVAYHLRQVLDDFLLENPQVEELKFEPGRYIPCEAGELVGKVTAVKYDCGKHWVGTDIGMNQLVRPSMYDAYHHIKVKSASNEGLNHDDVVVNFVGNVCESGDILGKDRSVFPPVEDDIVIVENAGAYGYSMASNYTGRCRPAEVVVKEDGEVKLIRRRETLADMLATIERFSYYGII